MDPLKELVKIYGKDDPQFVWSQCDSLNQLFYCNIEFLKNNLTESFYHYGELVIDSKPLVDDLIELHCRGIFTVNGQGSLINHNVFIDKKNIFCDTEQKPFLSFFMKKKHMCQLIDYFNEKKYTDDKIYYNITLPTNENISNLEETVYTVTRERIYNNADDLVHAIWNDYSSLKTDFTFRTYAFIFNIYPEIKKIINEKYIHVDLTTYKYGSNIQIEKELINFIKTI